MPLEEAVSGAIFSGLTLYPVAGGQWQASVRFSGDGWSIAIADSPSEALAEVFNRQQPINKPDFMDMM